MTDTSYTLEFLNEVLEFLYEKNMQSQVYFLDGTFRIGCNDFFHWGCADSETITPENFPRLKALWAEAELDDDIRLTKDRAIVWKPLLFVARERRMRPQGCAYPTAKHWIAQFDACGPKREVDSFNPYQHPNDGGEYAYIDPND